MKKITDQDPESKSPDVIAGNIEQLKAIFPEAFTEGEIDFDVLKQLLSGTVDEREEKYGLNWHGKRNARLIALTPSTGTLRPCPEDSVGWDTTQNLMIEGDNLEALKLLQKSYAGKVKLIYIDPPYNTGNDLVYKDDFKDNIKNYLMLTGQIDSDGRQIYSNTETSGRFHTDWLNMVYPRLRLARNLLSDDGAIYISIDDGELSNLWKICNEIFGQECYGGCVTRVTGTPTGGGNKALVNEIDYVLIYFKTPDVSIEGVAFSENDAEIYNKEDENGKYLIRPLRRTGGEDRREDRPSMYYPLQAPDGKMIYPIGPTGYESRWICGKDRYIELEREGLIEWNKVKNNGEEVWQVYQKFYLEGRLKQPSNLWTQLEGNKKASRDLKRIFDDEKVFSFPKPVGLLRHIVQLSATEENCIVLDFFAGSGTLGHAIMEQNAADKKLRRYILVQFPEFLDPENRDQKIAANFCDEHSTPRNIAEICKERLRRAGNKIREENPTFTGDIGFRVFKLDSSNIRAWEPDRDNLVATLEEHAEHLRIDRTEQDILFELLLKLGLDLTVPIEEKSIAEKTVYSIGAGTLLVCLSTQISEAEVEPLALGIVEWYTQQTPAGETQVVFRDSAFTNDVAKTNLTAILEQHGLGNVRSL